MGCFVKRECNEFFVHRLHKERDAAQLATQLGFRLSTANCALVERSGLQSLADAECAVLRGRERNDLDLESLLSLLREATVPPCAGSRVEVATRGLKARACL